MVFPIWYVMQNGPKKCSVQLTEAIRYFPKWRYVTVEYKFRPIVTLKIGKSIFWLIMPSLNHRLQRQFGEFFQLQLD